MPVMESSILTVLRERASLKPNNTAFTFIDYERDWLGVAQSLTWSQLYRRVQNVAAQLSVRGSIGDRAVILAPQGLDYIAAFSARCRRAGSRFRFRFRLAAPTMNVLFRCCVMRRRPPFSRHPPALAM